MTLGIATINQRTSTEANYKLCADTFFELRVGLMTT